MEDNDHDGCGVSTGGLFLGFDVAKDEVVVAIAGTPGVRHLANTPEAITAFVSGIGADEIALAAFEPTGGYERVLRQVLLSAGIAFARVHPNEIAAFRVRRAVKAKTDGEDARLIAAFAAEELARRGLRPLVEADEALRELVVRRRQLVEQRHGERCRAAIAGHAAVKASLVAVIAAVEAGIAAIEAEIEAHLAGDATLACVAANLRSFKCVGPVTVYTLFAELPELGRLSPKEIASLVGLAPYTRSSGKQVFKARIGHGRPGVRAVLFNVARSAIRFNPVMKTFYERLVTTNKRSGKVALVAVMRKIIVALNAIARENKPWKHANA